MGILNTLTIYRLSDTDSKRIKCSMPDCDKQAVYGENKGTAPFWYHCDDHVTKPVVAHSHTPGPWRYEAGTKTIRSVPANYWLASMDSFDGAVDHTANAYLIAAAPELLQAAKDVLEYMCADDDAFTTHEKAMRDSKLQGAIAKAEGHRE